MRTAPARTPLLPLLRSPSPPCHPLPFSLLAPCGHELRAPDRTKLIHRVEIRTSSSRMLTLMTAATSHTMKCAYHTLQPSFFLEFSFPPPDPNNDRLRLYLSDWIKREDTDAAHATLPCCVAVCVWGWWCGGVSACRFHLLGVPQDEPVAVQRQKPVRILNWHSHH